MRDVPFDPATVVRVASEILSVKRVFGEPFDRGGVTIIPVAKIMGGSGGGGGQGEGPHAPRDENDDMQDATGASETDSDDAQVGAAWKIPATGRGLRRGLPRSALAPCARRQPHHPRRSGPRRAGRARRGARAAQASLSEPVRDPRSAAARASRRTR